MINGTTYVSAAGDVIRLQFMQHCVGLEIVSGIAISRISQTCTFKRYVKHFNEPPYATSEESQDVPQSSEGMLVSYPDSEPQLEVNWRGRHLRGSKELSKRNPNMSWELNIADQIERWLDEGPACWCYHGFVY